MSLLSGARKAVTFARSSATLGMDEIIGEGGGPDLPDEPDEALRIISRSAIATGTRAAP
jgi:hypothetical protein